MFRLRPLAAPAAVSLLLLAFAWSCTSSSTSSNRDGGSPPDGDPCAAICAREHTCDTTRDQQSCTATCENDCSGLFPKLRGDVAAGLGNCIAQQDCATVLSGALLQACTGAGAPTALATTFCADWAAASAKCGLVALDAAQCLAVVNPLSDSAIQAADVCTTKQCDLVDHCLGQALPLQCGGTSSGGSGSSSGASSSSGSSSGGSSSGGNSSSGSTSSSTSSGSGSNSSSGGSGSGGSSSSGSGSSSSGSTSSGSSSSSGSASSSSGTTSTVDGTTGKACTADSDCKGVGGPGVNRCTTDVLFNSGALYPSGVCLMPSLCDPCGGTSPCDGLLHGCDAPAGSASPPGVCLPTTTPPTAGMGTCLPLCGFRADGNAPTGCVGKDVCNVLGYDGTQTPPVGVGFCLGGCTQDTDCVAGEKCDLTTAECVKTVNPPTKALGAPCTSADSAMNPPPCNCLLDTTSGMGFCTDACTVGGTECPAGWFCEAQEPTTLTGANDASVTGFTSQNTGLGGSCVPTCTVGVTTCPTNSTCKTTFAGGPGCIP